MVVTFKGKVIGSTAKISSGGVTRTTPTGRKRVTGASVGGGSISRGSKRITKEVEGSEKKVSKADLQKRLDKLCNGVGL